MEIITSVSNDRIKSLRALIKDRDERIKRREYVVEGVNIIDDMPRDLIIELFVRQDQYEKYSQFGKPCYVVSDKVMKSISDTVNPQGVIAVAVMPCDNENVSLTGGVSVVLDNIRDPGNVGTIIRTAAACGVKNIVLYGDVCDPYSPKAVRSSMGGIFYVNVTTQLPSMFYALDMGGINLYEHNQILPSDYGLVVGSEAQGVSQELKQRANSIISLPMNANIESLNAGVSLSVALYHFTNVLSNNR